MEKEFLITTFLIALIFLSGCDEKSPKPSQEVESCVCPSCEQKEVGWEYELECDKWKKTDVTFYEETDDCVEYRLYSNMEWYQIRPFDAESYIELLWEMCSLDDNRSACDKLAEIRPTQRKFESCIERPVQERVCVHKKVVGIKRK